MCGVWHAVFRLTESSQIALGSTRIARSLGEQVTGSITDTERLANHLEQHERAGARFVNRAGIRFTTGDVVLGTYNEEMSRIAR